MTDRNDFDEDPRLRDFLERSDPARDLTPADPAGLARLLEDTMATDLRTPTDLPQQDSGPRRRPLAWLGAAAAVAAIAGVGYAVSSTQDDPAVPQAGPSSSSGQADPETVTLQAPAAVSGKCAVPTPELLATSEMAFAGTVVAIDGDTVTLTPTETYAGETADEIEVVGLGMGQEVRSLVGAPEFVVGGTYLVSATGGQVAACGLSGEASPQLETLYDVAFR